LSVVCRDF